MSRQDLNVGIIGCGNISSTYLELGSIFAGYQIRACADIDISQAEVRANEFGIRALTVEDLLADDDIDIVVNLTVPDAHAAVSSEILSAGKHVYSEKPLSLSLADGISLRETARAKQLRIGCAPDTFLGSAHQFARQLVDKGEIGRITSGTCHVMSHGMEHWHPNPDFFYQPGGGPILDVGPYYIANLIQLIGPVKLVAALSSMASPSRTISSEPRKGETISVETPTNIHALLEFESGAAVTLTASWDVWAHEHGNMEIYGTEGTLLVPDPNFFGGEIRISGPEPVIRRVDLWAHPFGVANRKGSNGDLANYRGAGLADMAIAILQGRDHRCSLERSLHALDVMLAILKSGERGTFVDLTTSCSRPDILTPEEAQTLLR